ncbi:MAG: FAD-dependent oxidoreductase [Candidatus Izemoplasmatales bacterium]
MDAMRTREVVIIGGGPAGLAAAVAAYDEGCRDILVIERDSVLGGILNQCIHNGFGLHTFKEELTGPEYAARYIEQLATRGIETMLDTMVIDVSRERVVTTISERDGLLRIEAKAIVLAMGCRERPRGALNIPGSRPAGIFSAGTAQRFVNIEGYMPGKTVVILGSGDIGLIMARRLTLEGAHVKMVCEIMPYSGGLKRNIVQCLDDYGIPLRLSHTVTRIHGKERVEGVTVAAVDENRQPIPGTEEYVACDTLLLSVGLIPENELSRKAGVAINPKTQGAIVDESLETNIPGVFAAGNVLHVHDLVDHVSSEAAIAGVNAVRHARGVKKDAVAIAVTTGFGVRYTVPSAIHPSAVGTITTIRFRTDNVYRDAFVTVLLDGERVQHLKKRILTPGEMEEVLLPAKWFAARPGLRTITVAVERE